VEKLEYDWHIASELLKVKWPASEAKIPDVWYVLLWSFWDSITMPAQNIV